MTVGADSPMSGGVISLKDRAAWRRALASPRPVLAHLNADTSWLLQLPAPSAAAASPTSKSRSKPALRSRYNILIDPWLQGPQSDVASWFSTQWHVVEPAVQTINELDEVLAGLAGVEAGAEATQIDCVVISHEFSDHCHQATMTDLSKGVPVIATEKAADLIRSWNHFDTVITTPGFSASSSDWHGVLVDRSGTLPPWLGIGRVVSPGNALYYHSAVIIAFDLGYSPSQQATRLEDAAPTQKSEAVIYSPHGIKGLDLEFIKAAGIKTLALLHGLDDIRIWMTAQLNLGALNGIQAARASGSKYWVATHDEAKRGGGLISWVLQRTTYSLRDAVEAEEAKAQDEGGKETPGYDFVELGSGDGLLLA